MDFGLTLPFLYVASVVCIFAGLAGLVGIMIWISCPWLGELAAKAAGGRVDLPETRRVRLNAGTARCPETGRIVYAWDKCRDCRSFAGFESPCADQGWVKCRGVRVVV